MNSICVYTCITGDYDNLREIQYLEQGIDYYCFTNNYSIRSNTWNIVYIDNEGLNNVLLARKIKILGTNIVNKYDIAVWMDATVSFDKPILSYINEHMSESDIFSAHRHGTRHSIKEEAVACLQFEKESKENVDCLLNYYAKVKYPDNNGLIESTVYIKRPSNNVVKQTMSLWWDMVHTFSARDQLSFNYAIYKTGLPVAWIDDYVFDNSWFSWHNHNYKELGNYSIYFGDETKSFNYDLLKRGSFNVSGNCYSFNIPITADTETTIIRVTNRPCIKVIDIKSNIPAEAITILNAPVFHGHNTFFGFPGTIVISHSLLQGKRLCMDLTMEELNTEERTEFIDSLGTQLVSLKEELASDRRIFNDQNRILESKINELTRNNKSLQDQVNDILSSTKWKVLSKIDGLLDFLKTVFL